MTVTSCKDLHAPIDFIQLDSGRWRPVRPGTREFHRCTLEQTCDDCGDKFEGAPWMKTCPSCFKNNRPGREGFRKPAAETGNFGDPGTRSTSRYETKVYPQKKDEPLNNHDDEFDDIPF